MIKGLKHSVPTERLSTNRIYRYTHSTPTEPDWKNTPLNPVREAISSVEQPNKHILLAFTTAISSLNFAAQWNPDSWR